MNRKDWEDRVFASNMNPTAKMVCIAVGSHGNWEKDKTVWPTRQRIAGMAGTSRENAGKYLDELEKQGWLTVVGLRKDNVREYELTAPEVVVVYGILAVKNRGSKVQKPGQVVVSNDNLDEFPENQVVVDADEVVVDYDKQVVVDNDEVVVVYDTNLKNLQEEPTIEPTNSLSTVADAPVQRLDEEDSNLGEGVTTSSNSEEAKPRFNILEVKLALAKARAYNKVDDDTWEEVKGLALSPNFKEEQTVASVRVNSAVQEVMYKDVEVEW